MVGNKRHLTRFIVSCNTFECAFRWVHPANWGERSSCFPADQGKAGFHSADWGTQEAYWRGSEGNENKCPSCNEIRVCPSIFQIRIPNFEKYNLLDYWGHYNYRPKLLTHTITWVGCCMFLLTGPSGAYICGRWQVYSFYQVLWEIRILYFIFWFSHL